MHVKGVIFFIAMAFLLVMAFKPSKSEVVVFDSEAIKGQLIRQLAELHASDEQVRRATEQFKNKLHQVLTRYANRHQVMVVDASMRLAGGLDATQDIANELSRLMREKS